MKSIILALIPLIFILNNKINCESNADILNTKVERLVDLSTHLAKVISVITVENKGKSSLSSYTFVIEPNQADSIVYFNAQVSYLNPFEYLFIQSNISLLQISLAILEMTTLMLKIT